MKWSRDVCCSVETPVQLVILFLITVWKGICMRVVEQSVVSISPWEFLHTKKIVVQSLYTQDAQNRYTLEIKSGLCVCVYIYTQKRDALLKNVLRHPMKTSAHKQDMPG